MTVKFSQLVSELTEVWWLWMENNTKCRDESLSYEERRCSVDKCEELIRKEYEIVDQMDSFFKHE
tara:strand:- start:263 stop:457 length:195 start_codon:yes stop_codon:yes gene_type:complete